MTVDLDGLPAIVTGSSRGLRRAFAQALAAGGARVIVNGTDGRTAHDTAAAIRDNGGSALACVGSVADDAFCRHLVQTCVRTYGGLGMLVNNAGLTRDRSLAKMTVDEFDDVVGVHLRGTWSCSSAAARVMRADGGGRIVNITSGAGLYGTFGQANYSAAKAGIIGLTRVLDLELIRYGIRVNALAPVAHTDMTAVFKTDAAIGHRLEFPPAESVAPLVVHLAGPRSDHLHGQVLSFDGTRLEVWSHPEVTASYELPARWTGDDFSRLLTAEIMQRPHPDRWGVGVVGG